MAYLTCTPSPSSLGKSTVKIIILFRLEGGTFKQPDNDRTTACAFLSLKIAELILIKKKAQITLTFLIPSNLWLSLIFSFPIHINSTRDVDKCYDIDTANNLMLSNKLIHAVDINALYESTQIYSDETKISLNSTIQKLGGIGILTCPPYVFLVGNDSDKPFVIDSHAIPKAHGGNNNGIIVTFLDPDKAVVATSQTANIGPQDVPRTSHSNVLRTSLKVPISPSRGRPVYWEPTETSKVKRFLQN